MTNCQSCGMPMNAPTDFGGGKTDSLYCRYCTDATGNLLPKEVVRQNMIQFYTQTVGKTTEEATVEVDKIMGTMPAWAADRPAWKIQPSPVMPASPVVSEPVAPSASAEPIASVPAKPEDKPL